jgi:hypothetical protein
MEHLEIAYRLVGLRKGAHLLLARLPDALDLFLVALVKALPDTLDLFLGGVRQAPPHTYVQSQKGLKASGKGENEVSF